MKIAVKISLALVALLVLAVAGLGIYLSQANLAPLAIKVAKSMYKIDIPQNDTLVIKLFPSLHITGQNVEIPSLSGYSTPLLKAGFIDARIGWSAFPQFWAKPTLQNVTLSNAVITLYQPQSGNANWMLPQQTGTATTSSTTAPASAQAFTVPTFGQISLTNVDVSFDNAQTKQKVDIENIKLDVNGENLANLAATLGARLNGQELAGQITTNATNLSDVPLKGELTFGNLKANLDARVENQKRFAGQITLQTPNVRDTYRQLTTQSMDTLPAEALRLTTAVEADEKTYTLKGLKLSLGSILQLSGDLAGNVQPAPTAKGQINLQSNNLRALVAALQGTTNSSIPAQSIRLNSSVDYDPTNVKLTSLNVALADVLTANGTFTFQPQSLNGSAELSLQGSSLRQAAEMALGSSQPNLPPQPFTASTIAKISKDAISLPDIQLTVPQALRLKANLTVAQKTPLEVGGSATIEQLNLQSFGLCAEAAPAGAASAPQAAAAAKPQAAPWTDDVIDLSALQGFVGGLDVTVSNITCPSVPLQSIAMKFSNTPESLAIENLSANLLPSGKASVAGSIGHTGKSIQPKLQVKLDSFPAESLMPKASWSQGLALPITANVTLSANGNTTRKIAQTLTGTVEVVSNGGRIPASKSLNGLLNIEALLNGDPIPQGNGQDINDLKASYNIVNGLATASSLTAAVANNRIRLNGVGTVDLVGWTVSHTLYTTVSNQKDIPLTVRGNLNAPQFNLDDALKARIQGRLLKEGGEEINKLLTGSNVTGSKTEVITNAVGNLLGGKGLDQQGVQNLLGAFTKPKPTATPTTETPATEAAPAATEAPATESATPTATE